MDRILTTMLLALLALTVGGQGIDVKFRRLDTRDGLSNGQVNCVLRDSKGLVWIGTPYGLNRYDGFRVKTYYSQASDSTTMGTNGVDEMTEDGWGRLWLRHGTTYSLLDPETGMADRHPERWLSGQGVIGELERVYTDRRKNLWVKTYDNGLWHVDYVTGKLHHFAWEQGLRVSDMAEGGRSLVMITDVGVLVCYDTEAVRESWRCEALKRLGVERLTDYYVYVDPRKNVWVVVGGRVYAYLQESRRWFTTIDKALAALGVKGVPHEMKVWDMNADPAGRLWLATDHHGLCIVDGGEMHQFMSVKNDETTISDNTLRRIYRDQLGRMWISTYMNGVNYYAEGMFRIRHVAAGNVNTLCIDAEGDYWLGTNDRGVIRWNPKTGDETHYDKRTMGVGTDVIVSSLAATDGSLWFGTYEGGLTRYRDGRFESWRATSGAGGTGELTRAAGIERHGGGRLVHNSVWALCEDQWGNVWIGTLGGGLQRLERRTGKFTTLDMSNSSLPSNYLCSLQLTADGLLLVGHTEWYSTVNPKTLEVKNYRVEDAGSEIPLTRGSNQVFQDSRGLVWQAAASGVTISDMKRGVNYFLDGKSGLTGSVVNGLVEDGRKAMWVVTQEGLSRVVLSDLDGRWTLIVHSFSKRDGLQDGPYNQRSAVVSADGEIVIGGHDGIDIVNPANMNRALGRETPLLSNVSVEGHQLSVQLSSTSGEVHNQARFAYMLKGYDSGWHYTLEQSPDVVYRDLPSGDYRLLVRMLNDDGSLGADEAALTVNILRPWFLRWWMLLLYVVAVLLVARGVVRWRTVARGRRPSGAREGEDSENVESERREERRKLKPEIREVEITSLDEKLVRDATNYVEENLDNSDISVETMAESLGMSRVHLYKKLTSLTDMTPSEFIRRIRLEHAEQLLLRSQLTVAEVAYRVGFNNPRAFSKYFKEMYGKIPSEYKNRQG